MNNMDKTYTKARFWKCALQVNPYSYIQFRGTEHDMTEEQYDKELLKICQEEGIKVLGIADHGNVDGVNAIRELMSQHDIVVFPGFEIASSEKVHFVCLFDEKTSTDTLNRYLGSLELLDSEDGIRPSKLSAEQILQKIDELGGVVYAAHCTEDSGLLKKRLNHVWKNPLLKAAQIPGTIDDLKGVEDDFYRKVLWNKMPDYKRERSVAILNARDVERPETLRNPTASCLIKMTRPCFASFKQAFLDPESRVRLNSDVPEKYYSWIERVVFTGGYLDGLDIEFSEHLNAVIGGRGTGKSTLLESIRYGLEIQPLGKSAKKQHMDIVRENLGKEKGRIEITVRSSKMNGKRFTIARRYGESAIVKDENGNISSFTPADLLPRIEIYGQNEIYEIAQDTTGQLKLLNRFLDVDNSQQARYDEIIRALQKNREKINSAQEKLSEIEDEVSRLPKLVEQADQFKSLGLEEKLKLVPLLEKENRLISRAVSDLKELDVAVSNFKDIVPDTLFLSDKALEGLPHQEVFQTIRANMDTLKSKVEPLFSKISDFIAQCDESIKKEAKHLYKLIQEEEGKLYKAFSEIPSYEGKSGREIGTEFQKLLQEIERIRPKESLLKNRKAVVDELKKKRKELLSELSGVRSERSAQLQRALKRLNKKLAGKLRLSVRPEANRQPLLDFLTNCNIEGVGLKRLAWINTADDFSPVKLVDTIRQGTEALKNAGWSITPSVADALVRLRESELMEMEEIELPDTVTIELNVAHEGAEKYRPLDKLSTGQQCTAILHMLLLENKDPLIMDQPEDNLDNAFIADRIVTELRSAKIARQFLFATHNANIPVFGDAEWIGVFQAEESHATIPDNAQGAIDLPEIQQKASEILEGGKTAFIQRKEKYGF